MITRVGVLGVAFTAMVFRQDIAIHYHLYRLHRNPAYFIESVEKPEGSPQFLALQRFVLHDAGKRALVKAFIVEARNTLHDEVQNQDPWDTMPHYEGGVGYIGFERIYTRVECGDKVVFGLARDPHDGFVAWRQNDLSTSGALSANEVGARLQKLHGLLSAVAKDVVTLPEHPEFRFTVFSAERIREVSGFPWFYEESEKRPALGHACLAERFRPRNEKLSLLLKKLKDSDSTVRYWAVQTLHNIGAKSEEVK